MASLELVLARLGCFFNMGLLCATLYALDFGCMLLDIFSSSLCLCFVLTVSVVAFFALFLFVYCLFGWGSRRS